MFGQKSNENHDVEFFVMYDSKVQAYELPMAAMNHLDMLRQIQNNFAEPNCQSKYFINAEDYSLFRVAYYTKKTGKMVSVNPEHIANMHDLRAIVSQKGIAST